MADLTITAASVVAATGATTSEATAGASITAGQAVYLDASDSSKAKLADNDASATTNVAVGIALHAAASGQPIKYISAGDITIGATVAVGETYVLSSTAGGICPIGDLGSADYVTYLGYATSTTVLRMMLKATGVVRP